jgi:hypothetical protein
LARGTGSFLFSDIYNLDFFVQNVGIAAGRNLLVDILRENFSRDKEYRYERDAFGFPKTPSLSGLDPEAGIIDDSTTRLYIGSAYRYDITYLPAIIVRQTSSNYHPISFNQNQWVLQYERQKVIDGYGNIDLVNTPSAYTFAGAWDQTFEVKVISRSLEDVVALADIILISLQATYRKTLQQNGLFIKNVSAGGESAESIGGNDPLFSLAINVSTYSEWRREISISNLVDRLQVCFLLDIINTDVPATGLTIKETIE